MTKPVEPVPYSADWPATAERELRRLVYALDGHVVEGYHIGSTAVPGLSAKPVLDLLLVVRSVAELDDLEAAVRHLGDRCRGENGIAGRRYHTLDDATGRRRFQVHCFAPGSGEVERHMAFHDYTRTHPETAREYEAEKRRCREVHLDDSNAYCDANAGWIAGVLPFASADAAICSVAGGNSSAMGDGDGGVSSGTGGGRAMLRLVARAVLVWLVIIVVETVHGVLRTLLLVPLVGDFPARQVSVLTGALLIFAVAWVFGRWIAAETWLRLLCVGLLWVGLTVLFEIGLGRYALGLSWERIAEDYDVTRGGLLGFGLLFMAAAPTLAAWLRRRPAANPVHGEGGRSGD